jgi:hypothetical protein
VVAVDLRGVERAACRDGGSWTARMVSPASGRAWAGDTTALHLRWTIGFALVLLSGLAIAWVTGAARFTGWRRATTFALSLAAPLALATALTAAAYS